VALLLLLPRLLGWEASVTLVLTVIAAAMLAYSLLTDYEWGALRLLPMRAHLALDHIVGAGLLMTASLPRTGAESLPQSGAGTVIVLLLLGILAFVLPLLTQTEPAPAAARARRRRAIG
jgi:hypothetical protein